MSDYAAEADDVETVRMRERLDRQWRERPIDGGEWERDWLWSMISGPEYRQYAQTGLEVQSRPAIRLCAPLLPHRRPTSSSPAQRSRQRFFRSRS